MGEAKQANIATIYANVHGHSEFFLRYAFFLKIRQPSLLEVVVAVVVAVVVVVVIAVTLRWY